MHRLEWAKTGPSLPRKKIAAPEEKICYPHRPAVPKNTGTAHKDLTTSNHFSSNMSDKTPQTFEFQAEIRQLLDIVIHSLYTEKEIFLRELVSNAADALEKFRHLQLTEKEVFDDRLPLEIQISTDETAKTITIQDYGIGMTREELVQNLGTIAHSGSKAFLQALKEGAAANQPHLIGQFGVGFYSAFMVAESVTVYTRSWRQDAEGCIWTSEGAGSYSIEAGEGLRRGTKIVLKLKTDAAEFCRPARIENLLKHYSAFVPVPVQLNGTVVNTVQPLWTKAKDEITDAEYSEFYKFQAHAFDEPLLRLHFTADAPLQIHALLFVPSSNPEKFGFQRSEAAVSLYCKKVLIDAAPKGLLPEWLRFLKGVVDSEDLPLNISRETMQDRALIEKLNKVLTKRFLRLLEETATKQPDEFLKFQTEFGNFLKEGAAMDFTHREQLLKLLRFESSLTDAGAKTSFQDYISRMPEAQKEIYFASGASRSAIESSPYLEGFTSRNLEVIFCTEPVDVYLMNSVREVEGKKLVSVDASGISLPGEQAKPESEGLTPEETTALIDWLKSHLGEKVADVRTSTRLSNSPAVALNSDPMFSPHMRKILKAMNPESPEPPLKIDLEIHPAHPVIRRMSALRETDPERAGWIASQLLDNSLLAAGLLEDPAPMLQRLQKILEKL